ncbi:hypothetical protein FXO38_31874 [Capsicum annuum]|nr:hypothetical protein FXO38_31874 [Capsicum annuum]
MEKRRERRDGGGSGLTDLKQRAAAFRLLVRRYHWFVVVWSLSVINSVEPMVEQRVEEKGRAAVAFWWFSDGNEGM